MNFASESLTQQTFTCLKLALETLEKQDNNIVDVVLSLLLALNIFRSFYSAFIVDFEQVIVCWV